MKPLSRPTRKSTLFQKTLNSFTRHGRKHLKKIGKIKYHMLADPAGKLARMFDVLNEDEGQAYRGVFIVDPDGKIQSYTINNMGIGRSAEEILRTLQAAQFVREHGDQVCPANWKPGQDTIKPSLDLVGKL